MLKVDDPETGEIAYFSHPIDIHFATRFANIFQYLSKTGFLNKSQQSRHLLIVTLIVTYSYCHLNKTIFEFCVLHENHRLWHPDEKYFQGPSGLAKTVGPGLPSGFLWQVGQVTRAGRSKIAPDQISLGMYRLRVQRPNSWTYNFLEVSMHNIREVLRLEVLYGFLNT